MMVSLGVGARRIALCMLLIVLAGAAEARVVTIRWSHPNPSAVTAFRLYTRLAGQTVAGPVYFGKPAPVAGVYSIPVTISDVTATYVTATAYNGVAESARSNEKLFAVPIVCGNGILQAGEQCDDGNTTTGDGCSSTCTIGIPVCGNGILQAGEQCDDGNTTTGDGCSSTCTIGIPVCGNGILQSGEACDDHNRTSGDGCSATCNIEIAVCGDGLRQSSEACDDGNKTGGDGCSATCTVEVAVCGNGVREFGEGCDDRNVAAGDGCSATCVVEANPDAPVEYLINVGGPGFTTATGQVWLPDADVASGGFVAGTNVPIDGTNNDALYQTRRYASATGQPLVLEFPVPGTGPYRIRLHFAELDTAITRAGMRVFNVAVEDIFQLSEVDVFKSVGYARAMSRYFFVNVDDGVLTLRFEPIAGKPMLAGIEISDQQPPSSAPEFVDPCVESPADCQ
jgi:cysteine-rich repeat protein